MKPRDRKLPLGIMARKPNYFRADVFVFIMKGQWTRIPEAVYIFTQIVSKRSRGLIKQSLLDEIATFI